MLRIFMKYCIPHLKKKVAQVDHSCILTISKLAGASIFGSKKPATSRCAGIVDPGYLRWKGLVKYSVLMKYSFQLPRNRR